MKLSDDELARRVRAGDAKAFDALFDAYAGPLLGYLEGMVGNRGTAEDLLQETLLRVYRHIPAYREQDAFRAWLFRIATNLALSELRRRRYRAALPLDGEALQVPDPGRPDPHAVLEAEERGRVLEAGLERLADEQRAVILLRARQGMSVREIAEALCVPEGTVKSRLHHAVRRLREFVDRGECARTEDD